MRCDDNIDVLYKQCDGIVVTFNAMRKWCQKDNVRRNADHGWMQE